MMQVLIDDAFIESRMDRTIIDQTYPAAAAAPARRSVEKIAYINQFRALAIVLVILGHTYDLAWHHFADEDPQGTGAWTALVPALVTGATAYFVFISGFLYRHIFYGRQSLAGFLRKKFLNVGLPYLLLGSSFALAGLAVGAFEVVLYKEGVAYPQSDFVTYAALMATGRMMTAYWYIPAIFLIFLASPLFDRYARLALRAQLAVLGLAIGVALLLLRPIDNLNPLQSAIYMANFYLFGMLYAQHRSAIVAFTRRIPVLTLLLASLLGIALVQALVFQQADNLERTPTDGWLPHGLDLMLVQKYAGIFLVCAALARWGHHLGRLTDYLASISFGLFFVHGAVLAVLIRLPQPLSPHFGDPLLDLTAYGLLVIALSTGIVEIVRRLAGRHSRSVIGID